MIRIESKPVRVTLEVVTPIVAEFESQEDYEETLSLYSDVSDMLSDIGDPKIMEADSLYEFLNVLEMDWPEMPTVKNVSTIDESINEQSEYFY